jgi:hypothetical protein
MKYVGTFEGDGKGNVRICNVEMTDATVADALIMSALLLQETATQCARAIKKEDGNVEVSEEIKEIYDDMIRKIEVLKTIQPTETADQ